ncbi:hypothetical protein J6590_018746 [Homalodisca vitripennis]|nr:hypothetical protein J6590_018746 [Homalodisca vitripennis]
MSARQYIDVTINYYQSVPPGKKRMAAVPLADPPRRSPSYLTLSAEMDTMPPTQPWILPLYIDHIPDRHRHVHAALHRLMVGISPPAVRRVSLLFPQQASHEIVFLDFPFCYRRRGSRRVVGTAVLCVFQISTRKGKTNL